MQISRNSEYQYQCKICHTCYRKAQTLDGHKRFFHKVKIVKYDANYQQVNVLVYCSHESSLTSFYNLQDEGCRLLLEEEMGQNTSQEEPTAGNSNWWFEISKILIL
jgi:hypothetical protein